MKRTHMCLLGAISGDVIGSVYEYDAPKTTEFELFTPGSRITDDSILTLAVADAILNGRSYLELNPSIRLGVSQQRLRRHVPPVDAC